MCMLVHVNIMRDLVMSNEDYNALLKGTSTSTWSRTTALQLSQGASHSMYIHKRLKSKAIPGQNT